MAAPLLIGAGAAIGAIASRLVNSFAISPILNPAELRAAHAGWLNNRSQLPDPTEIYDAFRRGWYDADPRAAALGMMMQGVELDPAGSYYSIWRPVLDSRTPVPNIADAISLFTHGWIDEKQLCEMLKKNGANLERWLEMIRAGFGQPTIVDGTEQWLRGFLSDTQFDNLIRKNGMNEKEWGPLLRKMAYQMPLPQDVIRFVVREALNEEQAKILELDAELEQNPSYIELANAVGLGKAKYRSGEGEEKEVDVPKLFWRAHWELPSPTQSYEFLRRLRPNRIDRFKRTLPPELAKDLKPITGADLAALLKANDYAPKWRAPLSAISYLPLTRVDTRRLFDAGLIDKSELVEQYMDSGYVREDADRMADWAEGDRELSRLQPARRANKGEVLKAYRLGWLDRATASRFLYSLTLKSWQALREYEALGDLAQEQEALQSPIVAAWLAREDVAIRSELVTESLRSIRERLYAGITDLAGAASELDRLGLQPARREHYLAVWRAKLSGPRRTLALRQLIQFWREGAMTLGELIQRASRLGYGGEDLQLLLRSGQIRVQKELARQQAILAEEEKKRAQAQAKLVKEIERELDAERRKLAWKAPVTTLVRWLKAGRIAPETFRRVAALQGLKLPEIELHLQEAAATLTEEGE